jgi:hypothetical protein
MCHIQQQGGDIGEFLLSPPDVVNGFYSEISSLQTPVNSLVIIASTSCATFHLSAGQQTELFAIISHWSVQDAFGAESRAKK